MELHPAIRDEVINAIDEIEKGFPATIKIRIVQGTRTIEYQNELYAQGRTKPGKRVTNARGGKSYHNYGLAIDFAILYDNDGNGTFEQLSWDIFRDHDKDGKRDWIEVVDYFKSLGYRYGGDWKTIKDFPHLEKSFGYTTAQLHAKYIMKEFMAETKYVTLSFAA